MLTTESGTTLTDETGAALLAENEVVGNSVTLNNGVFYKAASLGSVTLNNGVLLKA